MAEFYYCLINHGRISRSLVICFFLLSYNLTWVSFNQFYFDLITCSLWTVDVYREMQYLHRNTYLCTWWQVRKCILEMESGLFRQETFFQFESRLFFNCDISLRIHLNDFRIVPSRMFQTLYFIKLLKLYI